MPLRSRTRSAAADSSARDTRLSDDRSVRCRTAFSTRLRSKALATVASALKNGRARGVASSGCWPANWTSSDASSKSESIDGAGVEQPRGDRRRHRAGLEDRRSTRRISKSDPIDSRRVEVGAPRAVVGDEPVAGDQQRGELEVRVDFAAGLRERLLHGRRALKPGWLQQLVEVDALRPAALDQRDLGEHAARAARLENPGDPRRWRRCRSAG